MMSKRSVKIVILFLLIIIVLVGGWGLYRNIEYNKQSFSVDMYSYLSPAAQTVVHINKEHGIEDVCALYPSAGELLEVFGEEYSLPVSISIYKNGEAALLAKASREQEASIREYIGTYIALPYPVRERQYKDACILFFSLAKNEFLVCAFHKGLFAVSKDYKLIEAFIDSDPENTFLTGYENKEELSRSLQAIPVSIFTKVKGCIWTMEYTVHNDSIQLEGSLPEAGIQDSTPVDYSVIPYLMNISDSLCVDSCSADTIGRLQRFRIFIKGASKNSKIKACEGGKSGVYFG